MKKCLLALMFALLMLTAVSALSESAAIPVIALDGEGLSNYTEWEDKSIVVPATLTYTADGVSFTQEITVKPQGTTSLYAPKKNFTIQFSEGVEIKDNWGAQSKYVLKADYIDPTRSGNVVSAKLAAEMNEKYGVLAQTPNFGVIDGFPVWVTINGADVGIFNLTIPKDAWLFNMDKNNPNHLVLACEGWSPASIFQSAEIDYSEDWSFEVGEPTEESMAAFERVVEFVSTASDEVFVRDFDQYLDLDACINYICFVNIAYGNDNVAKNMLMATYDGQIWYPTLYDLDSLWGIGFDGTALAEADGQWRNALLSDGNALLYRVNFLFADQVRERYWELREGILSKEHILESFEAYMASIPQEYYDIDHALWNANGERIRTLELMSQTMDEYLPIVDGLYTVVEDANPTPETAAVETAVTSDSPIMHYVWEADGIQKSTEDVASLPLSMTFAYTLDGNPITEAELSGKSGKLEIHVNVERKDTASQAYGIAALVNIEDSECKNLTVSGGSYTNAADEYVCMGSAWLGGTNNTYEMRIQADVAEFTPARYMVVASPLHFQGGGNDNSLNALLATAGELTAIIDDGIALYDSIAEMNEILTNVQNNVTQMNTASQTQSASDGAQADAAGIISALLTDAQADAVSMLTGLGYEVAEDAAASEIVSMLSEIANDADRTEAEKAQAAKQQSLIENYTAVSNELSEKNTAANQMNESLNAVATTLPELVGAYTYANETLYSILYRISTLYQDLSNYYYSNYGDGGNYDYTDIGDWYNVIIFSNYKGLTQP